MYTCLVPRQMTRLGLILAIGAIATHASAQTPADTDQHQHAGHTMTSEDSDIPATRDGSGTSWLPDETPMYALHAQARGWMLMGHGNAFLQYFHEAGDRGSDQAGSINWLMGMAQRPVAGGRVLLRGMIS